MVCWWWTGEMKLAVAKLSSLEPLIRTGNQKSTLTWYWSCFRSQSPVCISPADWPRSVARLPAPWSDVQTAAPAEMRQRRERGLLINLHICSRLECYFPDGFFLEGGSVRLRGGKTGELLCQFHTPVQNSQSLMRRSAVMQKDPNPQSIFQKFLLKCF